MTNPLTDAYVAGLIDGEGCIGITVGNGTYSPRVDVGMTAKARIVLELLQDQYGGHITMSRAKTARWDAAERWTVTGTSAAKFLRQIAPHLRLKAEQARIALKVEEIRASLDPTPTGRGRWTDEARERCEVLKRRIHELNRKGPTTEPIPGWRIVARLVAGQWVTDQTDLFSDLGWAPFSGTLPRSGMWDLGCLYARPTWERHTSATGSSSSPTLPTPTVDGSGSILSSSEHASVRPSLEAIARDLA